MTPALTLAAAHRPRHVRFGGLVIAFDERVLAPRAWTVAQAGWAAELQTTAPQGPVLELCAGAGQIGLLAVAETDRNLVMVDLNPAACALADSNARATGMRQRVDIRNGLMEVVLVPGEVFPVIIADPPWVRSHEVNEFPDDPSIAIDGGTDGLGLARVCCTIIAEHLALHGRAVLQLGSLTQVDAIRDFLSRLPESRLRVVEVRSYDGGVLALIAR